MRTRWWVLLGLVGILLVAAAVAIALWPWLGGWLPHPGLIEVWLRYLVRDLDIARWGPVAALLLVAVVELVWALTLGRRSETVERQLRRLQRMHEHEMEVLNQEIDLLREERQGLRRELELREDLIREEKARLWTQFEDVQRATRLMQRHGSQVYEAGPAILQTREVTPDLPEPSVEVRNRWRPIIFQLERIEMVAAVTTYRSMTAVQAQQHADDLMRLGAACYYLGQNERALIHYNAAAELAATDPTVLINRAVVNLALTRYQPALQDLDRALKIDERPWTYLYRGLIREHQGEMRRALDDYARAVRSDGDFQPALYRRGLLYAKLGEHDKALQDQSRVLGTEPHHTGALTARGMALLALGDSQWALDDLDKACGLAPDSPLAFYQRGRARHQLGLHEEALADFARAMELDGRFAAAYMARGDTYVAMGDHWQAVTDYGQAIELEPKNAAAYYARGLARAAMHANQEAIEDYDQALALEPTMAEALASRGDACEKLGDHAQAIENLDQAIALAPTLATAYYTRGLAYGSLGEYDRASRDLNRAVELDPSLAEHEGDQAGNQV